MTLNPNSNEDALTPAAAATLEEYVRAHREAILNEALRLRLDSTLTPKDIVNAHDALDARAAQIEDHSIQLTARNRRNNPRGAIIGIVLGYIALAIIGVVAIYTKGLTTLTPSVESSDTADSLLVSIFGLIATLGAVLAAALSYISYTRARSQRALNAYYALNDRLAAEMITAEPLSVNDAIDENLTSSQLIHRFFAHWNRVEELIRDLAQTVRLVPSHLVDDYPLGPLLEGLSASGVLDTHTSRRITELLKVRNDVVHGGRVSAANLRSDSKEMLSTEVVLSRKLEELRA